MVESLNRSFQVAGRARVQQWNGLFIAIGHSPAAGPFKGQIEWDRNGSIVTRGSPRRSQPRCSRVDRLSRRRNRMPAAPCQRGPTRLGAINR
jgi:thioredoxin reductase